MKNIYLSTKIEELIAMQTTVEAIPIIANIIAEIHLLENEIDRLRTEKSRNLQD